ncbi:glyoxylate/hydroxypyruvate reductase A-like isoform X2 [Babylonia areolata]|uniref:glyoxylate/hydroxypyruvate reductase A-like isoform X1 n=1 Tax=Babylonia areolata TaxID=304850 RepID=UPI003FD69713
MASRAVSRVFVASVISDLARSLQRQLASITVEDLPFNDVSEGVLSEERRKQLEEVEVILCDADALQQWLTTSAVPNLKWAQTTWAGVENLVKLDQTKSNDVIVTRSGAAYDDIMGEYVIGQIIAREKNFAGMNAAQQRKEFTKESFSVFRPLSTLSIGILGYGTIGKRVAEICKFLGMTVWAVNRNQLTSSSPHVDHFRGVKDLGEVLQNVDYLCNILPSTPASCDLLSGEVLKQCQGKKTVLINIGRGNVISDESLVRAVREGWLGGAILDVFNQEPLPADSPLWTLPNVVITPHVSGAAVPDLVAQCFVKNLERYMSGQPLLNVLDWDKGY